MKRPNIYSKPLEGVRAENYHPADLDGQYVKDLNKYIDYLETMVEKLSKADVIKSVCEHKLPDAPCTLVKCKVCGDFMDTKEQTVL